MEVVTSLPTGAPGARGGTKKHVEEWSRLDQLTGMLEHARVEADHWSSNTSNSRHHYGKVVDSRARNLADGSVQQQQKTKQLEVFQAHIPGGSVQVIRSHTSTSSSWHNSKQILRNKPHLDWPPSINGSLLPVQQRLNNMEDQFDDFKLHNNLVNLNIEKSKANVARLLPSRRPPTRAKLTKTCDDDDDNEDYNRHRPYVENGIDSAPPIETTISTKIENNNSPNDFAVLTSSHQMAEATSAQNHCQLSISSPIKAHATLTKKKSISDENLALVDDKNANSDSWKRNSKSRWSFQYTRSKFKDDTGGELGHQDAKSELESVLQRVLRHKGENLMEKLQQNHSITVERGLHPKIIEPTVHPKRKTFVTEKSLQETKQRLRHLNCFDGFGSQSEINNHNDSSSSSCSAVVAVETDDGICTDSRGESDKDDECSSANGVASDSTSSFANSGISSSTIDTTTYKSDEWYDRRKSYGFEPVSNFSLKKTIFSDVKPASKTNLSTDSGICRSSELELASTSMVRRLTAEAHSHQDENQTCKTETPEPVLKSADVFELLRKFEKRVADETVSSAKPMPTSDSWRATADFFEQKSTGGADLWRRPRTPKDNDLVVPQKVANDSWIRTSKLSPEQREPDPTTSSKTSTVNATNSWNATTTAIATTTTKSQTSDAVEVPPSTRGRVLEALESLRQSSHANSFEPHLQLFRRSNDSQDIDDLQQKRHSIACDDAKYVMSKFSENDVAACFHDKLLSPLAADQLNTTVVNINGDEVVPSVSGEAAAAASAAADVKKPKKVEFSKTEVHFAAAEPGKIKIVETDEKPPPANLYRRKKRSVSASPKMQGVGSYTKFGDHEEHRGMRGDDHECKPRTARRSSVTSSKLSNTSHTWPGDDSSTGTAAATVPKKKDSFSNAFGSSTCDNGLAVTISSMRPQGSTDVRRASWSIFDGSESKMTTPSGYSTKINFGREGVTVIADTKSRKQSVENVAPQTATEEILEKSHFKPLRMEDEKVKTVTGNSNVDIKCPKITSVAVNILQDARSEDMGAVSKKFTTVLVNANNNKKSVESSAIIPPMIGAHDSNYPSSQQLHQDLPPIKDKSATSEEHIIPLHLADDHHCRRTYADHTEDPPLNRSQDSSSARKMSSSRAKTEHNKAPVTIIHHGVRLQDRELVDSRHLVRTSSTSSSRKEMVSNKPRSRKSVPMAKDPKESSSHHVVGMGGGSLRKKATRMSTSSVTGKERLFDSGRDSWLNLPKDRKSAISSSSSTAERREYSKVTRMPRKPQIGDATSSDLDGKQTISSRHHHPLHHHHHQHHPSKVTSTSSTISNLTTGLKMVTSTEGDVDADAAAGITSATYTDVSSDDDISSRRMATYRKQFSKPLTTISEKGRLHLVDHHRGTSKGASPTYAKIGVATASAATATTTSKPSVARTTSNSSLESRSNSYEFKYPVLKTEERSKRRAARMLQRATSREALMKGGQVSSSEDITSDNEKCNAMKTKTTRKVRSISRMSKPDAANHHQSTRISALSRSKPKRIIQQRTATMKINIFNIKDKPDDRKRCSYGSTKAQCPRGKKESDATSHQKTSNLYGYGVTKYKNTKDGSISSRIARPVQ